MKINYKYAIIFTISIVLFFTPLFLFIFFTGIIQKKLSGIEDIEFLYGVTNLLPGITLTLGSIFLGLTLGYIFFLVPIIFRPGYREYDKKLDSTLNLPKIVTISHRPYIGIPSRWLKIPQRSERGLLYGLILLALALVAVLYLSLNDYTAANENAIYEKYYFMKKEYSWQNIDSATLEIKYHWSTPRRQAPQWDYSINLILSKGDEKIYIWKDNGLARPKKEEIIWLLNKLTKENISIKSSPIPNNILEGLYQTNNDFRNRIYPPLAGLITQPKTK